MDQLLGHVAGVWAEDVVEFGAELAQAFGVFAEVVEGCADGGGRRVVPGEDEGLHVGDGGFHEFGIEGFDVVDVTATAFDFFEVDFEGEVDDVFGFAPSVAGCEAFFDLLFEVLVHFPGVVSLDDRSSNVPEFARLVLGAHFLPLNLVVKRVYKNVASGLRIQVEVEDNLANDIDSKFGRRPLHAEDVVLLGVFIHDLAEHLTLVDNGRYLAHNMAIAEARVENTSPSFPDGVLTADEVAWTPEILHECIDHWMLWNGGLDDEVVQQFNL